MSHSLGRYAYVHLLLSLLKLRSAGTASPFIEGMDAAICTFGEAELESLPANIMNNIATIEKGMEMPVESAANYISDQYVQSELIDEVKNDGAYSSLSKLIAALQDIVQLASATLIFLWHLFALSYK